MFVNEPKGDELMLRSFSVTFACCFLCVLSGFGCFSLPARAAASLTEDSIKKPNHVLKGYVKDMYSLNFISAGDRTLSDNLIHNRLNYKFYSGEKFSAVLEMRNRIFWGESLKLSPNFEQWLDADPGYFDFTWVPLYDRQSALVSTIDRGYVDWSNNKWSFRLGRQRINWGITSFWNSNDLFNAYSFLDFDYEERPGVDAFRLQRFTGELSSITAAIKPGKHDSDWVGAMMWKFNKRGYDVQLLSGWYYEDVVAGLGWAGGIRNIGFKGEATYFHPQENAADTNGVAVVSSSLEYVFKNGTYLSSGYLYNGNGSSNALILASGLSGLGAGLTAKSLMPGKHSALASVSFTHSPRMSSSLVSVYSPSLDLLFLMPSYQFSLNNQWSLSFYSQMGWLGKKLPFSGAAFYLRARWDF